MGPPVSSMLYARQFVAGCTPPSGSRERFERHHFADALPVAVHELCRATALRVDDRELLCIGDMFDPAKPAHDNLSILKELLTACQDFESLERSTSRLSGRWALFAKIAGRQRLYPDAAGLKAVFYCGNEGAVCAASQPGLLRDAGIEPDQELIARLWRSAGATAWPAALVPYRGVKQLLPNHYLDLTTGQARRFWPTQPVKTWDLGEAAQEIHSLLLGTLRAIAARGGSLALPLTGGIDSRVLLACAGALREELRCFTVVDTTSPFADVWLPARLAYKLGLRFKFVWAERMEVATSELLRTNTGSLWRDGNEHRASAFGKVEAQFMLLGNVSEVCRCYYYKDGVHPTAVDGARLAELSGWGQESFATAAYEAWLESVPSGCNVNVLDLFYWESRVGNWAALDCMALDSFVETAAPFNCRALLEIGLGVDVNERKQPYGLHRAVCRIAAPETLEFPVNTTWLDAVQGRVRKAVPSSVRAALRRARRRLVNRSA